jgi:hypothetical protein
MTKRGFGRGFVFAGLAAILFGIGAGIFFLRAPVLIVTDPSFNALYGTKRRTVQAFNAGLTLFRPVRPVIIADGASPDIVAFAVEEAARSPYCILFPYRYNEGARQYAARYPHRPVFVLGRRNPEGTVEETFFVETDVRTDLYRAGLCAGIIAQNGEAGEILFFQNETLSAAEEEAFEMGLKEADFEKPAVYMSVNQEYSDNKKVSCAVIYGSSTQFLIQNIETPVVLFSWIDPDLTAASVKLVFDDSPWALVTGVVHMIAGKKPEQGIPSAAVIPGRRIRDKRVLQHLKNVIYNNYLNI